MHPSRLGIALVVFALASSALGAAADAPGELGRSGGRLTRSADGRIVDATGLSIRVTSPPREAASAIFARNAPVLFGPASVDLRLVAERRSLTGTHLLFRQYVDGAEVVNAGFSMSFDDEGRLVALHNRAALRLSCDPVTLGPDAAIEVARLAAGAADIESSSVVGLAGDDGVVRLYDRVIARVESHRWAWFIDAASGRIHHVEPLFQTVAGQVFDPNPVTTLNQPALQDDNDAASAVPQAAYIQVDLQGLSGGDHLIGPYVEVTDLDAPFTRHPDPSAPLLFTRDQDEFEDVMVYFHIDRSQRYLESLGFTGSSAVASYPIQADAHATLADNSSYDFASVGRGTLHFGDGGVDDAEDADVIIHEYGHAIEDWIVPNGFSGIAAGEPRAVGEGFGDYWAFSAGYAASVASGRDPFCIADWDARCADGPSTGCSYPPGADCLRRVDGTKTMDDFVRSGPEGIEHSNGEIWSSALREIFMSAVARLGGTEGRRTADRTVIESHFGLPPNPSFRTCALRLLDADRRLNAGLLSSSICSAMTLRKILTSDDCDLGLHGDLTLVASPARALPIPDNQPAGISSTARIDDKRVIASLFVKVDIAHPHRGDLRITLVAPDGTSAVLQVENGDSASDIHATYGFDTEPAQSLGAFIGKPGPGTWTLIVSDNFGDDVGVLLGWSLLVRFSGDDPLTARDASLAPSLVVPVSGNAAGAAGTHFISDVRLFNAGSLLARVTAFFTPSAADGTSAFGALQIEIAPGQTVALDDVVGSYFRTAGIGNIGFTGDTGSLIVTSRIYNASPAGGTYGQFLRAVRPPEATGEGETPLEIGQLRDDSLFRSNVGITEVSGAAGNVEITIVSGSGATLATIPVGILPFSHVQLAMSGALPGTLPGAIRAEVRVRDGGARVVAYGSAIDNLSGDAIFVPAAKLPRPASTLFVPAVIRADGANGTRWSSDVCLVNLSPSVQTLSLRLLDGRSVPQTGLTLAPGAMTVVDDVVGGMFATTGAGALEIDGDALAQLLVTSRTSTPGTGGPAQGSYGQFIPSEAESDAFGAGAGPRQIIQVEISSAFRTNVGLSEVGGAPAVVRVTLFDGAGTERFSTDVSVAPLSNTQFNLQAAGAPAIGNGRVSLEVVSGSGVVMGYASVVDNTTGDPIFIGAATP